MSYTLTLDRDKKIIRYRHAGIIGKDEIGQAWNGLLAMDEFTDGGFNLLTDYNDAKYNLVLADVEEITVFLLNLKNILEGKKQAMVVNEHYSTAVSILFEGEANRRIGFKVKVFSTLEAAESWLLS